LDTFWEQHKLPCTFVIKKHHVSYSGRGDFITFSGNCVDANCKTAFFGGVAEEPIADNDVEVSIITADIISVEHTNNKKRFLRYPKRQKISEVVQCIGATQWQRNFADECMDFWDDQPPTFYSKDILRKAKQDVVDSNLGIQGSDPVLSLIELKHGSEHSGSIHTISIDKIFVHYWSPMQCHMYKVIRR